MQIYAAGEEQLNASLYKLGITQLKRSFAEKDPGHLMDTKLNMSWYHTFAVEKVNGIVGCFRRHVARRLRNVIFHLLPVLSTGKATPRVFHSFGLLSAQEAWTHWRESGKRPQRP